MSGADATDDTTASGGREVRVGPWRAAGALSVVGGVAHASHPEPHRTRATGATRLRHYVEKVVPVALTRRVVRHVARVCHVRVRLTVATRATNVDVAVVRGERLAADTWLAHGVVVGAAGGDHPQARGAQGAASLAIQVVLVGAALEDSNTQL